MAENVDEVTDEFLFEAAQLNECLLMQFLEVNEAIFEAKVLKSS